MGFLDSVKNVFKGAVAAPAAPEVPEPDQTSASLDALEPVVEPEPVFETYTIRTGDTLGDIGARHGLTRDDLARVNGIEEPDLIFPGQELRIPTG